MLPTQFYEKLLFILQNHHPPQTCGTFKWEAAPTRKLFCVLWCSTISLMVSQPSCWSLMYDFIKKEKNGNNSLLTEQAHTFQNHSLTLLLCTPCCVLNYEWEHQMRRSEEQESDTHYWCWEKNNSCRNQFLDKTHFDVRKLKHSATSYAFYRVLLKTQKSKAPFLHKNTNVPPNTNRNNREY